MSITGVSVTKSISFRGAAQEFSNTYYYYTPLPVSSSTAEGIIDNIVAKERAMHATSVSFVRARCWKAGGTKSENEMLFQKQLSGTGAAAPSTTAMPLDRERAFLVRFRAGQDVQGRPVYLRKWWHLDVSNLGTINFSAAQVQQTATLSTAQRNALANDAEAFKNITVGVQGFELRSEKNRQISGDTQAHQYIEHHQLGDMWRG